MRRALQLGLVTLMAASSASASAQDRPKVIYTPIVLTGQGAPGPLGGSFRSFPYHSVINDADQIVFLGSMGDPWEPQGLFLAGDDDVEHVAHRGQPAPGFPSGVEIQSFDINYHRANNKGQVVFESTLVGPGIDETGVDDSNAFANWFWSDGELQFVAQFQTPAPGTNARFRTFARTTVNDLGHVAFAGDLVGDGVSPGNDNAMWYGPPDDIRLLAREGSPGPGGVRFGGMEGLDFPYLAANGQMAFTTGLVGGGKALFAGTADDLQLVAKSGDTVPETDIQYNRIEGWGVPPRVNNKGDVVFVSTFSDGSRGILTGAPGKVELVARTGEPAPGLGDAKFDFFHDYGINDKEEIAFRAETKIEGVEELGSAIYTGKPNQLELIAADGQHAPGTEGDVFFWYFHDPVINRDGQVAFFATLRGPDARGESDYGLFATGHEGDLRLIARYGDQFEVAPGDMRTIDALSHAGVHGTHIVTFNEDSDLAMLVRFTDGSEGIFTARVLPEPTSLVLCLIALAVGARLRRTKASHS
jgi:hypothetical protein